MKKSTPNTNNAHINVAGMLAFLVCMVLGDALSLLVRYNSLASTLDFNVLMNDIGVTTGYSMPDMPHIINILMLSTLTIGAFTIGVIFCIFMLIRKQNFAIATSTSATIIQFLFFRAVLLISIFYFIWYMSNYGNIVFYKSTELYWNLEQTIAIIYFVISYPITFVLFRFRHKSAKINFND